MEHTKGEWEVSKHGTPDYAPQYGIHNGGRNDFGIVRGENAEADAQRICQCVNNFDELLEACKACIEMLVDTVNYEQEDEETVQAVKKAEQAIIKAESQ